MKISLRFFIMFLVVLIFLLPNLSFGAKTKSIDVSSYANLKGTWNYKWTENGKVDAWSVSVLGTTVKNGKEVYLLQEYDETGDSNDQDFYLTDMSKGLYRVGGINNFQRIDEYEWFLNPEMPVLLKTFVHNKRYSYSFQDTRLGSGLWTIKIIRASVKVPAGKFKNCYKSTIMRNYGEIRGIRTSWYCKDIGLVKRITHEPIGTESKWELTSYEP